MLNVTIVPVQPSDIGAGYINQTISWTRPYSYYSISYYLVQYRAGNISFENETVRSTITSTVLRLPILTNTTTYSVWVAAVSSGGQGEFSDRVDFTYSSEANTSDGRFVS